MSDVVDHSDDELFPSDRSFIENLIDSANAFSVKKLVQQFFTMSLLSHKLSQVQQK